LQDNARGVVRFIDAKSPKHVFSVAALETRFGMMPSTEKYLQVYISHWSGGQWSLAQANDG
jgi:hypothetical protein